MAYLVIELLETVTRSSSIFQILEQYCWSILSQAGDEENLHGIWKSFHPMEVCKEIFHDIQKNLYIMEVGKELFHGIQKTSYIMEAHIKSTSPQSSRSGRQSFQNQFVKHHVVRQPVS